MQIALAAYVTMAKQEGNTVYVCRPWIQSQPEVRDALLRVALQRLANKARPMIHQWIESGRAERIYPLLFSADTIVKKLKLNMSLRDRTVQWKMLLVVQNVLGRSVAFSPSMPDLWFDLSSPSVLEMRAIEVYTQWCQEFVSENPDASVPNMGFEGDAWIEPVDLDLTSLERKKKQAKNPFAAMMGSAKMRGDDELRKTGRCLDELATEYSVAVGRDGHVSLLDQLLQRPDRQPVMLVGPSGGGKSAIIQECVLRRTLRHKDRKKQGRQTWLLSPQRLISGMSYLGQWEERWLAILREATRRDHILYFDDPLGLLTAGLTRDSKLSVADVLKSYLALHPVRLLAETTYEALAVLRRKDRALADFFHLMPVEAVDEPATLEILQRMSGEIEAERGVFFHPSVLPAIIEKQRTLAPHLAFPGKGVEVLKNLSRWGPRTIGHGSLLAYLKQTTGVSLRMLDPTTKQHGPLRDTFERRLIGQPAAIDAVERVAHRACHRLSHRDRPHGVLLFLGPTGVGKTECAKALNAALFVDESHLIRFDMNEITTAHAAEQLIGTFDEPDGRLTSAVRRRPFSVILFDEIEKAHPDVYDYLLQVIGEGRLTDAHGRTVDFRNTFIIMTSNLGVQEDQSSLGFDSNASDMDIKSDRYSAYERSAQRFFRPEFFNRIDEVVVFRRLDRKDIAEIAELQISQSLARDGMMRRDIFARIRPDVIEWLVDRGFDKELGARAMKRSVETHLIEPLGDLLSKTETHSALFADISRTSNPPPIAKKISPPIMAISGPISCQLQSLSNQPEQSPPPEFPPSQWVAFSEAKIADYSAKLASLNERIQAQTPPIDPRRVQYYAIHDQVYRSRDSLKQLKQYLESSESPRIQPMQLRPSAVKRTGGRSVGDRRFMMDYQSEMEIQDAIDESASDTGHKQTQEDLLVELKRSLALTDVLLNHAEEPSRWVVEFRYATRQPREFYRGLEILDWADEIDNVHLPAVGAMWDYPLHPVGYFTRGIASTLRSAFQYEVEYDLRVPNRLFVSGIGVAGLLKYIVGTYRIENAMLGRDLAVLVAYPIDDSGATMGSDPTSDSAPKEAKLEAPSEWDSAEEDSSYWPMDWTSIRGIVSEDVRDLATNSSVAFHKSRQAWADWWNDLLPRVEPSLQANSSSG